MITLEMIKDSKIKEILSKIQNKITNIFGDKLEDIILYGSYARLQNTKDSDVDIIVFIDESDNNLRKYEDEITDIMVDLSLEYEVVVSIYLQSYMIYKKHANILPFFINVREEGVSLYG